MSSRRPPSRRNAENIDQRQSRQLQSMIPGTLSGRLASAALPPSGGVTGEGLTTSSDEGGGIAFQRDRFVLASGTPTLDLSAVPLDGSLHLYLNREYRDEDTDYTLSGLTVSVLSAMSATAGDILECRYAYTGDVIETPDDETPSPYTLLQTATGSGNGSTTATFASPTTAGSFLVASFGGRWHNFPSVDFPAGWTVLGTEAKADADYEDSVWIYPNAPATTSVTVTDDFINESQLTIAEFAGFGAGATGAKVGQLVTPFDDGDTLTSSTAATDAGLAILGWSSRYYSGSDATGFTAADVSNKKSMLLYRALSVGQTIATDVTPGGGTNPSGGVAIVMAYLYDS